jgi:L-rhamnose isomerase
MYTGISGPEAFMAAASSIEKRYHLAREQYADLGVDTQKAIDALSRIPISLHCWQGDDVTGFEQASGGNAGILATGNYPGKARTPDELRADIDMALGLLPGMYRVNLHAIYAETSGVVDRAELTADHFSTWIAWAKARGLGLDFNPTFFNHPKAASGFTLSSTDEAVRVYWVRHAKACRRIAAEFGKQLGTPSVHNIWIPDGCKDMPADRARHRDLLRRSLDGIFAEKIDSRYIVDTVESKLFGIGSESYVVGSHEFYLGYAVRHNLGVCLDMGHFHPTESVADKISSVLQCCPLLLLHISRGVRWDSDHVAVQNDELQAVAQELVRGGWLDRTHIALDYFDASINRIAAWVIGMRATRKALLRALLEPVGMLKALETSGDLTGRLALMEECASLPYGAVWDYFCERGNVKPGTAWLDEVRRYEREVLSKRAASVAGAGSDDERQCLDDLVFVSHVLGHNPSWVQAGGGNTSVKSADGSRMYIKASGTGMSAMSTARGWVCIDVAGVRAMLDNKELARSSADTREAAVRKYLESCVLHPRDARPSVEAPLHALLGRVVMHSHPVAANALTCHVHGERILRELDAGDALPALWAPFMDPGAKLAFTLHAAIAEYRAKHGVVPQAIFQQNHGFFCSADTAQECIELHECWMERISRYFAVTHDADAPSAALDQALASARLIFAEVAGAPMVVRPTVYREIAAAANAEGWKAFKGALTPDHIVYAGPAALLLDADVNRDEFRAKLAAFRDRYDALPKIIVIRDTGVLIAAATEAHVQAAEELAASALQTAAMAGGSVKFMARRDVDFIVHWEVEQFRQKQMA